MVVTASDCALSNINVYAETAVRRKLTQHHNGVRHQISEERTVAEVRGDCTTHEGAGFNAPGQMSGGVKARNAESV